MTYNNNITQVIVIVKSFLTYIHDTDHRTENDRCLPHYTSILFLYWKWLMNFSNVQASGLDTECNSKEEIHISHCPERFLWVNWMYNWWKVKHR